MFTIRMGVPEMKDLWKALAKKNRQGKLSKSEAALYRKWGKALKFLSQNPRHPGLASHEIDALSRRYGEKVWQSYLENNTPGAGRMFWVYGPGKAEITVIGLESHRKMRRAPAMRKYSYRARGKKSSRCLQEHVDEGLMLCRSATAGDRIGIERFVRCNPPACGPPFYTPDR